MKQNDLLLQTQYLDINMPLYTFKNLETNEEYDEVMSYEKLQEYLKQDNIQQVFKFNMFRYSDYSDIFLYYFCNYRSSVVQWLIEKKVYVLIIRNYIF